MASPVSPTRGACRLRAGQRGALAGSGRGPLVPPAPAGSMNESAWKWTCFYCKPGPRNSIPSARLHRGGCRPITGLSGIRQGAARCRGLLELARAPPPPPRATVHGRGGESTASAVATPRSSHPHTDTHTRPRSLETAIPVRTAAALHTRGLARPVVRPPAAGGCRGSETQEVEQKAGRPGGTEAARWAKNGPGSEICRWSGRAMSPEWSGLRDLSEGSVSRAMEIDEAATARLPRPGGRAAPRPPLSRRGWDSAARGPGRAEGPARGAAWRRLAAAAKWRWFIYWGQTVVGLHDLLFVCWVFSLGLFSWCFSLRLDAARLAQVELSLAASEGVP